MAFFVCKGILICITSPGHPNNEIIRNFLFGSHLNIILAIFDQSMDLFPSRTLEICQTFGIEVLSTAQSSNIQVHGYSTADTVKNYRSSVLLKN